MSGLWKATSAKEILLIAAAFIIMAGTLGSWFWHRSQNSSNVSEYQIEQTPLDKLNLEIQNLSDNKNYDLALSKIEEAMGSYKDSPSDLANLYSLKGYVCSNQADYKCALAAYIKANELKEDFNSLVNVADVAAKSGDKELAREYYQKTLDYAQKQGDFDKETLEALKQVISELGT